MDCDNFDQHVIDALYDELDELTMAAMKRHMEGCSRCASAFSALRATRDVAVLPLEEPSEELESRILFAASAAQRKTPWHRKALRGLAWAGSHAMRPQLAMAAVFVLVIGSSLLLLRAKPGTTSIGPVRVTERGEPSPERDEGAQSVAAATAAPGASMVGGVAESPSPPAAPADVAARGESKDDGEQGNAKGSKTSEALVALADAKATEGSLGCDAALPKYDDVAVRFSGTSQAADAMWAAASCHKKRGDTTKARELYGVLAQRDGYKDKAEEALTEIAPPTNQNQVAAATPPASAAPAASATANQAAGGAGKAGAAAPAAAPMPKAASPAKPAAPYNSDQNIDKQAPGWGGSRPNAAPEKRKAADSALVEGF
jgi:hypothetical protein